jgi:ubiquinone/menaquinone biosynthesis C-methylase UbiE
VVTNDSFPGASGETFMVPSELRRKDSYLVANYGELAENLRRFYDFTSKVVLFVGAGTRQLLDPTVKTKKLIAIDRKIETLGELKKQVAERGAHGSVEVIGASFEDVLLCGDVVYFEFCLHEMRDPQKALEHARTLAHDVVVL